MRKHIPGGPNTTIPTALDTLAQYADETALAEVEACPSSQLLWESYGDRDADPLPWELDPQAFQTLVRWWERLGLVEERSAQLVADWLGDSQHFGSNGSRFFLGAAPELAARIAPRLLATLPDTSVERRRRAVDGLGYVPTAAAVSALIARLDDPAKPVRSAVSAALQRLA
jgi:hypothetical protein